MRDFSCPKANSKYETEKSCTIERPGVAVAAVDRETLIGGFNGFEHKLVLKFLQFQVIVELESTT